MATSVQIRGNRAQLRIIHKLLPRPFIHSFDTEAEARDYGARLLALLDRGIIPAELAAAPPAARDPMLAEVIRGYTLAAPITASDDALLTTLMPDLDGVRVGHVTYAWAESYVRSMKARSKPLAPGSIRKRVGVLARVLDWHCRTTAPPGQAMPSNAMRLLPAGYSAYSVADAVAAEAKGGRAKRDVQRDRRMTADELRRIDAALAGERRPDRERGLTPDPEFFMLYRLILHTGLRLREAYTRRPDDIDLKRGVLAVDGTKGARGAAKPRHVPITPELEDALRPYLRGRVGLLFPSLWDGRPATMQAATNRLSARFAVLFRYAEVPDATEHDLRHEATCCWVEMRRAGGWLFSDLEVCRIMGWKDPRMMLRYASLRGEDLAARLRAAV